uniref:Uncharacterized protein n=1 Tax=Rhizophora mucronata TaxID=61149 RepID=A0A2P2QUP2_RHIMU
MNPKCLHSNEQFFISIFISR